MEERTRGQGDPEKEDGAGGSAGGRIETLEMDDTTPTSTYQTDPATPGLSPSSSPTMRCYRDIHIILYIYQTFG